MQAMEIVAVLEEWKMKKNFCGMTGIGKIRTEEIEEDSLT